MFYKHTFINMQHANGIMGSQFILLTSKIFCLPSSTVTKLSNFQHKDPKFNLQFSVSKESQKPHTHTHASCTE